LRRLLAEGPERASIVEGRVRPGFGAVSPVLTKKERVDVLEYSPNRIIAEADLQTPGMLIFCENVYPGWNARIDGEPAEILPANLFMRAVPVPAGRHRVEMTYAPRSFRNGAVISAATLTIVLAGFAGAALRRWRRQTSRPVEDGSL